MLAQAMRIGLGAGARSKALIKVRKHVGALLAGATAFAVLLVALSPAARAQSITASSSSFNAGYGRTTGQENRMVDVSTRDANGNRVIVDGVMQTGEDQSVYASAGGAWDSYSGVGGRYASGSSTAIGNNLTVITQGSNNTVIVNSSQTNNGAVTAGTHINGGVGASE